ncbi:F-box protein GID2 [Hibiscus syriacus]|uniref:F-box protein GID2 n=1 Tax=Hibiscus syriacus TaxID=106335 RepID=A0A6A2YEQ6_HIBSY|nr:F-box protein GID2 [Hibiscus syriacus]
MKRCASDSQVPLPNPKMKKIKQEPDEQETGFMNLDENLLYEVLKHVDARTLAMASCVSKQWQKTAKDERLWELICTRHWANIGCGTQQLRSVVLPLGGFRRLHSLYLWPLSKPQSASASSWAPPFPKFFNSKPPPRWGKDEQHVLGLKKMSGPNEKWGIDRIRFGKISLSLQNESLGGGGPNW